MNLRVLGCAVLLAVAGGSDYVARAADPKPPCCFTNPQYSGVCKVQPAEGETCDSILAYLNNPNAQGKTYCDNSNVRGGWHHKKCGD